MSEESRPGEERREEARPAEENREGTAPESRQGEKSTIDKAIDKAQEKGLIDKAARMLKGKLSGR